MHAYRISPKEFKLFQDYIYSHIGISLSSQKVKLVESRLSKRLKKLNLNSFKEYYDYVVNDRTSKEILYLIDAISTNVTSFFREPPQWSFLKDNLKNILDSRKDKKLRIWSAACSAGQEPYSIAIFLFENIPNIREWDIKILATDISPEILQKAQKGIYSEKEMENVPKNIKLKYFKKDSGNNYHINEEIKKLILFRMFNLVYGNFAIFKKKFNIIFCRNVMIYFNSDTQQKLVSRFRKIINEEALLFVGHSESLTKNQSEFKLVKSSIYKAI